MRRALGGVLQLGGLLFCLGGCDVGDGGAETAPPAIFYSPIAVAPVGSQPPPRMDGRQAGAGAPPVAEPGSSGVQFVAVPAGRFTMGSPNDEVRRLSDEGPQHEVTISAFELSRTEVTNAQYRRFLAATGGKQNPDLLLPARPGHLGNEQLADDIPAVGMTRGEAEQFARWAGGRLPTEAEWEYAARAGSEGSRYGELADVAWYEDNSELVMQPVAMKQPNAWGLFDMLGNVWEWCSDWYGPYDASAAVDPTGPSGPDQHRYGVRRGGGFRDHADHARAAARSRYPLDNLQGFTGFRVARDVPTGQ